MGNFKDNPEKPFEVRVPNKIRKRIAMHERGTPVLRKVWAPFIPNFGSMWSRLSAWLKKFF